MTVGPLTLTADTFVPHPLHATERSWTETNCYVDVWIEVLHALGLDPRLPEALLTKAATQEDRDFSVLERDYRAALAANPTFEADGAPMDAAEP